MQGQREELKDEFVFDQCITATLTGGTWWPVLLHQPKITVNKAVNMSVTVYLFEFVEDLYSETNIIFSIMFS